LVFKFRVLSTLSPPVIYADARSSTFSYSHWSPSAVIGDITIYFGMSAHLSKNKSTVIIFIVNLNFDGWKLNNIQTCNQKIPPNVWFWRKKNIKFLIIFKFRFLKFQKLCWTIQNLYQFIIKYNHNKHWNIIYARIFLLKLMMK